MADATSAPAAPAAATPAATQAAKPVKPDQAQFEKEHAQAEKEHKAVMAKLNAVKEQIDLAQGNKNKDQQSPVQKRRQELIAQANEIRQKQAGFKNARNSKMDQIKRLDEQLKSRIAEQKTARGKVPFKSLDELDGRIESLESQVNSGRMKLVDEKKALSDISSLKKLRKTFGQFDDGQKQIDELKAKIKEIKDAHEDPEQKAISERYTKIQEELDSIKAQSDEAFKGLSALRDERSKLQAEQQEKFLAMRKLKDDFYSQKRAFGAYEREAREKYRERQRQERERIVLERKKAEAERMLQEASDPAFLEELRRANSLLKFLDPSFAGAEKAPLLADSGLGAQAQRKVDDSALKGTKLLRKEDREEDYLPAVRKGKKSKKANTETVSKTFSCPPSVVQDCAFLGIDPPMAASEVPAAIEKVKAKIDNWKSNQAEQTKKNIEKAKKEIARLEAEEDESSAPTNGATNGDASKEVEEATSSLKEATIKDEKA